MRSSRTLVVMLLALLVAGCGSPATTPPAADDPSATSPDADVPTADGPKQSSPGASAALGPEPFVVRDWYNASWDGGRGLAHFVEGGFGHSGAAQANVSADPTLTALIVEARWDDPADDVELQLSVPLSSACTEFPPSPDPDCFTDIPGAWLDLGDDGYYQASHVPGAPASLRIELDASNLAAYDGPQAWDSWAWVRSAAVDVRIELALSTFHGTDVPDGYTAFP